MRYKALNNHSYSSFRNALRLLNLFNLDEPELNLSEIAERLNVATSTAHRLVHTLMNNGFLVKDPISKCFRPASSILSMGNLFLAKYKLYQTAVPILENLTETTGETAHIAILKGNMVVYLYKIDSEHPVHLLSHAGRQNPIHCTSSGQVILAFQNQAKIDSIIDQELTQYTEYTITNPKILKQQLAAIKKQGYAVSHEEMHKGVTSIAAPIKSGQGIVNASVSIAGPTSRITQLKLDSLCTLVKRAASTIENLSFNKTKA